MIKINKENIKIVFILEDDEGRIDFFNEVFKDCDMFITKKVQVAKKALKQTKFDIIFLDHDLEDFSIITDERIREITEEETGVAVAKMIRDTINRETPCIIHSMNPVGASAMVKAHPFNTAHIPFYMLRDSFKEEEKKI